MRFRNKKADIAITILVLGIIVLCILSILNFYLYDQKSQKINKINLNDFYNAADSMAFSGYSGDYEIDFDSQKKSFEKKYSDGGVLGTGFLEKEILKIKYMP